MALEQAARGLDRGQVLDLCDQVLGAPARRSHIFGWLAAEEDDARWIPVDAYYPSQRLVVQCMNGGDGDEERRARLVREHGLRYVTVEPEQLTEADDPAKRLADLVAAAPPSAPGPVTVAARGAPARREAPPKARETDTEHSAPDEPEVPQRANPRTVAEAELELLRTYREHAAKHGGALARAARLAGHPVSSVPPARRHRQTPKEHFQELAGGILGLLLLAIVLAEVYLGVSRGPFLGIVLSLDALGRVYGTLTAMRAGRHGFAWVCAIVGSLALLVPGRRADD